MTGWHLWFGSYTGVVLVTVAVLPLVVLTVWVLARRRAVSGSTRSSAWRTSLTDVGIVYGTVPWVWMTMLPGSRAGQVTGAVSLVPLRDLATMSTMQVLGNLLIFAALGFLVPFRFPALASVARVTALAATGSALIETAQYVLRLDRVSSIDDVLLNATGAALAALVSLSLPLTVHRAGAPQRTTP
jgi:glycopeptide antibiotics resistance protein